MKAALTIFAMAIPLGSCDYTEEQREIGYKGQARLNPWLAAERFAGAVSDEEIHSHPSWTVPDPADTVWFLPAAVLGNESFTKQAERWVLKGGHLVLLGEYADVQSNDWSLIPEPLREEAALQEMLGRCDLKLLENEVSKADKIVLEGKSFEVAAASSSSVVLGGGQPSIFASTPHGAGQVSVLMDARLFRNRWIGQKEHAAFLGQLMKMGDNAGGISFTRGSGLSLWGMMVKHLWAVMLALGILIGLWLWKNFARFGPVESTAEAPVLRGYDHHLEALGNFQWRLDRGAALLAPLRAQIIERGRRLGSRVGRRDDDFFQFMAERAGISRERAFRALGEPAPADALILTRTVADLQLMLQVLH